MAKSKPFLLGLCGVAGVGKDTVGGLLGYSTFAFARTLKTMLTAGGMPEPSSREEKEAFNPAWGFSWRDAAQRLGTEWGRGLNTDIWVKLAAVAIDQRQDRVVVLTDCRFENEAAWIRSRGLIVHITGREATVTGANAVHASEAGVAKHEGDYTLQNSGTFEELNQEVRVLRQYIESLL